MQQEKIMETALVVSFLAKDEIRVKSKHVMSLCLIMSFHRKRRKKMCIIKSKIAQNCIDGFNSTCFAYGQTGSGNAIPCLVMIQLR